MLAIFAAELGLAAVPSNSRVEGALRLPLTNRLPILEKQGPQGREALRKMAFDKKETLENRWRAITAYGRIYKGDYQDVLEKALNSSEWFMRNAALIVAPYAHREWAVKWARLMMHDPALVVRTAAVQTLRQLNASESRDLLWVKFYSSENYRSGESLWIRRHILEALVQFAGPGQEGKFVAVLNDRDASLHPFAIQGLEKVTHEKFTTAEQWSSWWQVRQQAQAPSRKKI